MEFYEHQKDAIAKTQGMTHVAIEGYEGLYEIDRLGNVYSVKTTNSRRKGIIKPFVDSTGYRKVKLYDKFGKPKNHYVHRLVALHFLENESGGNYVDHKDCNKLNNHYSNLEWVTQKENITRSKENGLQRRCYKCIVDGIEFLSMTDASKTIFNKKWLIKELRYKYGNEFIYAGHFVKVVV